MFNETAVIDLKGESFPLDLNLQDVSYNIEVEIRPEKYTYNDYLNLGFHGLLLKYMYRSASELQLVTCGLMYCFCCSVFMHN